MRYAYKYEAPADGASMSGVQTIHGEVWYDPEHQILILKDDGEDENPYMRDDGQIPTGSQACIWALVENLNQWGMVAFRGLMAEILRAEHTKKIRRMALDIAHHLRIAKMKANVENDSLVIEGMEDVHALYRQLNSYLENAIGSLEMMGR